MTGRWKARKSKTPLSLPSHRPLEISPNTVRFPHSHPTANEKIGTLLTDSKKPQLERKVSTICPVCCVNYVPGCTNRVIPEHRRCGTRLIPSHVWDRRVRMVPRLRRSRCSDR